MSIYLLPIGDGLTDPRCFTPSIHQYLDGERELIQQLSQPYDIIVEACCSDGRYASLAENTQQKYIGIDIAEHHIQAARKKYAGNNATFECDDISKLDVILDELRPGPNSLVVFPFNAFGNLHDAVEMLAMLQRMGISFLISTYATDKKATVARMDYYAAAGFTALSISEEDGIRFTNQQGLNSIAYYPSWFEAQFKKLGLKYRSMPFDEIGMAYMNF